MSTSHQNTMRVAARAAFVVALACGGITPMLAQPGVESRPPDRWRHYERDLGYGVLEGLAYAGVDQARHDPPEWGTGGSGYEKRAASNVGEFVIQESVTEGLAAAMHRPVDYARCGCRAIGSRIGHALALSVVDQMPDGRHALAIPRIVGAFAGSFAQASWRPGPSSNRMNVALGNAATSLAIGAGINLFHEFVK